MITLRDIIKLNNFRYSVPEHAGMYRDNTETVRIYFEGTSGWFEFGINDFDYEDERDKKVEKIITKKFLDKEVVSIRSSSVIGCLEIYLQQ